MKATYIIIAALLLISAGCSSAYRSTTTYDDVYYDGSERYLENIRQEEPRASGKYERNEQRSKYESEREYPYEDFSDGGEEYVENGNTYITNNYFDAPYDYFYSARIRRFSRPFLGFSYFGPCYADYRWYDPYFSGVSIYMSWGNPGWGWGNPGWGWSNSRWGWGRPGWGWGNPFFYSYRPFNSWGLGPWNDPFYSGYNFGYWNGFNDGFFYGSGFYSGFAVNGLNNGFGNTGYSESYTPADYYYGPRFANNSGSNSGMRGQRSDVQYGKNDGSGANRTNVNAASVNNGQLASPGRNGNLNKSGKTATVGNNYFEKQRGNEVSKRGGESLSGIRTVNTGRAGSSVSRDGIGGEKSPRSSGALIKSNSGNTATQGLNQRNTTRQQEWNRYKSRQYNSNRWDENPSRSNVRQSYERNGSNSPSGNRITRPGPKTQRSDGVYRRTRVRQERRMPGRSIGSPERRRDRSISSPRQLQERRSSPPSPRRSTTSPKRSSSPERSIRRSGSGAPRSNSPSRTFSAPSRSRSYSSPSRSGSSRPSSGFSSPSRSSRSSSGGSRSSSPTRLRGPR